MQIAARYAQPASGTQQAHIRWIMDRFRPYIGEYNPAHVIIHSCHGWRHKFIYDGSTLAGALEQAGFGQIERLEPGASYDKQPRGIEPHGDYDGGAAALGDETMVFEATKP